MKQTPQERQGTGLPVEAGRGGADVRAKEEVRGGGGNLGRENP